MVDGAPKMIVSGLTRYDAFGRVKETFYPVVDDLTNKTIFNTAFDNSVPPTITTYDVLDRVTKTRLPDSTETNFAYSSMDGLLKTTVIDAKNNKQETFANGSGLTVKTLQYKHIDPDTVLTTLFEYDDVNQLKKVTDDAGKTTESLYDWAGNRTQVKHPASGITTFGYDPAGNTLWKFTANKDSINYGYEYNRLTTISYPRHPENNVVYTYGLAQTSDNRAGRLVGIEDGSGAQEFKYGRQGEVTEVRRTLVIPNQGVASYVTRTSYDSWNRIQ